MKSEQAAAKIGHVNEEKFLKQFWKVYQDKKFNLHSTFTLHELIAVYRPGLVAKKNEDSTFVKDSADGVMVWRKNERGDDVSMTRQLVHFLSGMNLHFSSSVIGTVRNPTSGNKESSVRSIS